MYNIFYSASLITSNKSTAAFRLMFHIITTNESICRRGSTIERNADVQAEGMESLEDHCRCPLVICETTGLQPVA